MANGRESMMTPEQELREEARREQLRNNTSVEERQRRDARDAVSYATHVRPPIPADVPVAMHRPLQVLPLPPRAPTMEEQWLADNPSFTKNDGRMIPGGSTIAVIDGSGNNPFTTVQTVHDLFFPQYYMGKKIVGVRRNNGGTRRRRRSRKSKRRR